MHLKGKNILITGGSLGLGKETAMALLKKGANIYLEGQLTTRKWRDEKSGQDKYSTEVVLQVYNSSLTMLDGKNRTNNASEKSALPNDQTSQDNSDLDDEIPF